MSFPRYAEYKDGGVEWQGKVPAQLYEALRGKGAGARPYV